MKFEIMRLDWVTDGHRVWWESKEVGYYIEPFHGHFVAHISKINEDLDLIEGGSVEELIIKCEEDYVLFSNSSN